MFTGCLTLPHDPYEARLVADALDSIARALHEWPADAWRGVRERQGSAQSQSSLFERLAAQVAPLALDARQRKAAAESAEEVAAVLRCLWPETQRRLVVEEAALRAAA